MRLQSLHGVLFVAAVAALGFLLALPTGWTDSSPLPWDEAGHLLGAVDVRDGLVHGDARALRRGILGADQYPPGHSIALGGWMAAFGTHVASWLSFGLLVYVLTAVLLARLHVAAGFVFIGLGMFGGLAPSLMVEPLAVLWVVLALTILPRSLDSRGDGLWFIACWIATCFALMTKYNFGLPLVAALMIASLVRWERRMILASIAGAVATLGSWAGFLALQDQGWEMFRAFAENRANSVGMSPIGRLSWYLDAFREQWIASASLGIGLAGILGMAIRAGVRGRRRDPRFFGAAVLATGTLVSFALHPYLLGRNLVIPVAALVVLIGVGLESIEWRKWTTPVHAIAILVALLTIPSSNPQRTSLVKAYFPDDARDLQPISKAVEAALEGGGFVRVIGTFDEFSAGWVRLLQHRAAEPVTVSIDAPYPLERGREALDARGDPAYEHMVESWAQDGTRQVVGIEVDPHGRFHDDGYMKWSEWKLNLLRALDRSSAFAQTRTDSLDVGVRVVVYDRKPGAE